MHGSFICPFVSFLLFALSLSSVFFPRLCTRSPQTARRLLLIHSWWDKAAVGCAFSKVSARFSSSNPLPPTLNRQFSSLPNRCPGLTRRSPSRIRTIPCLLETWNSRTSVWKQLGNDINQLQSRNYSTSTGCSSRCPSSSRYFIFSSLGVVECRGGVTATRRTPRGLIWRRRKTVDGEKWREPILGSASSRRNGVPRCVLRLPPPRRGHPRAQVMLHDSRPPARYLHQRDRKSVQINSEGRHSSRFDRATERWIVQSLRLFPFPPIVSHPRASPLHRLVSSTILPLQPRIAAIYLEGDEGERKRDEDRETYFKTFGRISPISLSLSLFRWIIDSRDGNLIGGRLQPRNSFVSTAHKPD